MKIPVSPRHLPLVREVDVVVAGGTVAAAAAALAARAAGANVLLAAPRMYLGDDLCGSLRLWCDQLPEEASPLLQAVFNGRLTTTPLRVKRVLEDRLLAAGVEILLGCLPVGSLLAADGEIAGVVLANRAGRQAVAAKAVVSVSRPVAGAGFSRVVLGGTPASALPVRSVPSGLNVHGTEPVYHEYDLPLSLSADTPAGWAELEQQARDLTYHEGQLRAAEMVYVRDGQTACGPALTLSRRTAEAAGRRAGGRAAALAAQRRPTELRVSVSSAAAGAGELDLAERRNGLRLTDEPAKTVECPADALPVLAAVDVVVVGGGTSGAAAAIAAAREGKEVLVLEYQECLGGVGTIGLITKPYAGLSIGFAQEVPFLDEEHGVEYKMEWLRRQLRQAGGSIWLQALTYGTLKSGNAVRGVAVATPYGHGAVRADVVIDATGNAEVAAAAGAEIMFGADETEIASQGVGLSTRPLGRDYVNSDYLLVDDSDVIDVTRALLGSRQAVAPDSCFDTLPFIQSRERQRVVGDVVLSYLDQVIGRTYPDSIVHSSSDYDSHGYPSLPFFALLPHTDETRVMNHPAPSGDPYTPYRALLPQGLDGLLVIGLGTSMHRDAVAMMRMQKDLLNQGYAAGLAAAAAVRAGIAPRAIDVKDLQQKLIAMGALPASVLTDRDSFPLAADQLRLAVADFSREDLSFEERSRALAVIFTQPETSLPLVLDAFAGAPENLDYAKLLGFLGSNAGVELLIGALTKARFDARIYQGHMAEYAHLPTPVDALILAAGYGGDSNVIPALLAKLDELDAETTLSHHRSLALALEHQADRRAALPLARLLQKPGMAGHVMQGIEPLVDKPVEKRRREGALREIVLARALYRCGDHDGLGQGLLQGYRADIRGHFARHAAAVLAAGK